MFLMHSVSVSVEAVVASRDAIPSLNQFPTLVALKEGSLVRFKCMVQDTLDSVMKHKSVGRYDLKYRNALEGVPDSEATDFSEDYFNVDRYTVVSIPGERGLPVFEGSVVSKYYVAGDSEKRSRAPGVSVEDQPVAEPKRFRESMDCEEPPALIPIQESYTVVSSPSVPSASVPTLAHPVPTALLQAGAPLRISAIANVCDSDTDFKLHDVVEIVGLASHFGPSNDYSSLPLVDLNIQVLSIEKVQAPVEVPTLSSEQIGVARSALKSVLMTLLGNDELAAEYLLLHLVSTRAGGNEQLPTLGSWSLGITNADSIDSTLLSKFLSDVVPGPFVALPASNEVLLKEKFYPHRSPEEDFTSPGMLQLASNSTVLIDERELKEGPVNALNVLAITKAVRDQQLIGVFGLSDVLNFPIDSKFVILSSGPTQSLFSQTNPSAGVNGSVPFVTLELKPEISITRPKLTSNDISLSPDDLELVRRYIAYCQLTLPKVAITDTVVEQFQADWVQSRKVDSTIPTDDIHIWATLTRTTPASFGASETTNASWGQVVKLEAERRARITVLDSSTGENRLSDSSVAVTGA